MKAVYQVLKGIIVGSIMSLALIFFVAALTTDFALIRAVMNAEILYESDLKEISKRGYFGKYVSASANREVGESGQTKLSVRLFDIFRIRNKDINISKPKNVSLGGEIVAMFLKPEGLIVDKVGTVKTKDGEKEVFETGKLKEGDIIIEVAGKKVQSVADIQKVLLKAEPEIDVKILRGINELTLKASPQISVSCNQKRLGVFLRDDFGGIGTLTYIDGNGRFGALGHSISVYGHNPDIESGRISRARFLSVEKAEKGKTGSIRAAESFEKGAGLGEISKNSKIGVFGTIKNKEYLKSFASAETASRFSVKPGAAKILTQVGEGEPEFYDVKILKASKQHKSQSRGIVLKVTDKRLIEKTGGIVQGMSGSPIVQNGKIVGAVTHVFLNDATKGYGIYLDFMMQENNILQN